MARRKSGSSIIFRLGVERFLERLSLFLALDLLLCVLFAGAGLWVVETRAAGILADAQSAEWTGAVELGGWSETKLFCVFSGATLVLCVLAFLGVMNRYPM